MKRLLVLSVVFAVLVLTARAEVMTIPVVRTWGDLRHTPKISVIPTPHPEKAPTSQPAVEFQVGVGGDADADGAALLYFLLPGSPDKVVRPEQRGLFTLEIDGIAFMQYREPVEVHDKPGVEFLFTESIRIPKAGDHIIRLLKPIKAGAKPEDHQAIAQAVIHVGDNARDYWYPFWPDVAAAAATSEPTAEEKRHEDGTIYAEATVWNPQGGAAVPAPPPFPLAYTPAAPDQQALPTLKPAEKEEPKVSLRIDGAALVAKFDPAMEGFFPRDFFLARWWVNGKPARLDPFMELPSTSRILAAQVWMTNEVRFQIEFRPEWLGVKAGDRVAIQLLYCPEGYDPIGLGQAFARAMLRRDSEPAPLAYSQLSNRVEFTYSGNPKHPVK